MRPVFKLMRLLILLISGLAVVLFCLKNQQLVPINFWGLSTFEVPVYLLLVVIFFIGVLLVSIYLLVDFISMSNKVRVLNKKLLNYEKELDHLRTLPLSDNVGTSNLPSVKP